jgi:hypothetical protein
MAEGAVKPHAVVKDLDVFEDGATGMVPGEEAGSIDSFGLEGTPKAFHVGVVFAVGLAAHAGDQTVSFEGLLVEDAGVLDALVAVMDDTSRHRPSPDQRLAQGRLGQRGIEPCSHGQAEHPATATVQHPSDVEPAFPGWGCR